MAHDDHDVSHSYSIGGHSPHTCLRKILVLVLVVEVPRVGKGVPWGKVGVKWKQGRVISLLTGLQSEDYCQCGDAAQPQTAITLWQPSISKLQQCITHIVKESLMMVLHMTPLLAAEVPRHMCACTRHAGTAKQHLFCYQQCLRRLVVQGAWCRLTHRTTHSSHAHNMTAIPAGVDTLQRSAFHDLVQCSVLNHQAGSQHVDIIVVSHTVLTCLGAPPT